MAKQDSFTVSVKDKAGVVAKWMRPDGLADAEWSKRVAGVDPADKVTLTLPKAVAAAINDLAIQQFVIKMQSAGRGELSKGAPAVQAKCDRYQYGARGGSAPSVTIDAKAAKLTKEQITLLEGQGVVVLNK